MSRKSAASLAVVALVPGTRPRPPKSLSVAEAVIWRQVANTKPAEWFTPDTYPLLLQYCRHAVTADQIAEELKLLELTHGSQARSSEARELWRDRDRESKAITNLARQLRISQQSLLTPGAAGTASRKAAGERKPWQ